MEPTSSPAVRLTHLDQLWFQVAGTLCNLTCHHCFISCSPKNDSFGFLSSEQVKHWLQESVGHGVKEYYFTGGEPFLNPQFTEILCATHVYGPATVLTNGTVLKDEWLERLRDAQAGSPYGLEFRVSLDGFSAETNDPIRGAGTFARAMKGIQLLVDFGFLPIITAARTWPLERDLEMLEKFAQTLARAGYHRPRLKLLPTLQLGAETERTRGYSENERLSAELLVDFDYSQLICDHSRIVTDRGVHVCPILIDSPDALLGKDLDAAAKAFPLDRHGACLTCYQYGAICSNPSGESRRSDQGGGLSRSLPIEAADP